MIFTMVTGFVEGQSKYKSVGTGQRDNLSGECPTVEWGAGAGGDPKGDESGYYRCRPPADRHAARTCCLVDTLSSVITPHYVNMNTRGDHKKQGT